MGGLLVVWYVVIGLKGGEAGVLLIRRWWVGEGF